MQVRVDDQAQPFAWPQSGVDQRQRLRDVGVASMMAFLARDV